MCYLALVQQRTHSKSDEDQFKANYVRAPRYSDRTWYVVGYPYNYRLLKGSECVSAGRPFSPVKGRIVHVSNGYKWSRRPRAELKTKLDQWAEREARRQAYWLRIRPPTLSHKTRRASTTEDTAIMSS